MNFRLVEPFLINEFDDAIVEVAEKKKFFMYNVIKIENFNGILKRYYIEFLDKNYNVLFSAIISIYTEKGKRIVEYEEN